MALSVVSATVIAYLLGGVPFGYLFVRFALGKDIRTMGSGNIGATNVHRSAGGKAGLIVLLLDILKGYLAVLFAGWLTHDSPLGLALSAAAVMIGHSFPVFLRFKGGKAVACFIGAFLYIAPLALLAVLLVFVLVVWVSKYISLGSVIAALLFPLAVWMIMHPPEPILISAIFAGLLITYRHKANIQRILAGNENVFSLRGRHK
ncbi:MAG: glycerol-3-phosphate 1-O-acyltransferase PlsY [Bryobacteraceae bacterium]